MKTYLTYGFAMAFGGALVVLALYFLGMHDSADKFDTAQWIQTCLGLAIGIAGIVLGTQARRTGVPAGEPFGYGSALGAGVMITRVAALLARINHTFLKKLFFTECTECRGTDQNQPGVDGSKPATLSWLGLW